ncbi:DUF2062 domain-containing protein [Lignipirellula cremea]|uniref:DUF2062 domain-containing protein n=1 Tax=Lignipirellula cremea TaxID=2528010 RepID=UPI0018D21A0F|nr:DUF2062 domain-containing protein [Lignipirellula cremea]
MLHADDPPHRLALGVALAMFVTFTPTVGIQMLLVVCFAWLFGANKAVGLPIVWISNPATMLPIFYGCYWLGRCALGGEPVDAAWWEALRHPPVGFGAAMGFYWAQFWHIAGPLWLGSLIVATGLAVPTYYAVYFAVCRYRMQKWGALTRPTAAARTRHSKSRIRSSLAAAQHDAA